MELDSGFKDRLRWAINLKETNQSALARAIGTTAQAIQQWVSGATLSPRRDHLMKACEFLGVRYDYLAYGRGPMKLVDTAAPAPVLSKESTAEHTETALLSHEWEAALLAAVPESAQASWQYKMTHPSGTAPLRITWVSDKVIAELGLYKHTANLINSARQRLWLLAVARELVPPAAGRRTILLLAPLESWREVPDRHIGALRAEARTLGIEVIHVGTPEHAAAVLLCQEAAPRIPVGEDLGLDVSSVL